MGRVHLTSLSDLQDIMEGTFIKFEGDSKFQGPVNTDEGRTVIQMGRTGGLKRPGSP